MVPGLCSGIVVAAGLIPGWSVRVTRAYGCHIMVVALHGWSRDCQGICAYNSRMVPGLLHLPWNSGMTRCRDSPRTPKWR